MFWGAKKKFKHFFRYIYLSVCIKKLHKMNLKDTQFSFSRIKQELSLSKPFLQNQIRARRYLFCTPIICLMNFINEMLEIEKNNPTSIISVLKVEYQVSLVFSISNFLLLKFIRQIIGVSFSCSNSAFEHFFQTVKGQNNFW